MHRSILYVNTVSGFIQVNVGVSGRMLELHRLTSLLDSILTCDMLTARRIPLIRVTVFPRRPHASNDANATARLCRPILSGCMKQTREPFLHKAVCPLREDFAGIPRTKAHVELCQRSTRLHLFGKNAISRSSLNMPVKLSPLK